MNNKRWITSIVYIALGVGLLGCGIAQILDEFWSGMGGGLLCVGLVRMIQMIRYQKNETYKEAVDYLQVLYSDGTTIKWDYDGNRMSE